MELDLIYFSFLVNGSVDTDPQVEWHLDAGKYVTDYGILPFWTNNDQKFQTIEYFSRGKQEEVELYVLRGREVRNIYF